MIIIPFILPILISAALILNLIREKSTPKKYYILFLIFSFIAGFFLSSLIYFFWLIFLKSFINYSVIEIAIAFFLLLHLIYGFKKNNFIFLKLSLKKIYPLLFFFSLLFFLFLLTNYSRIYPHGSGDGWSIWNTKARFIFGYDNNWKNIFREELRLSHTDYPLLLPLSVARGWTLIGKNILFYPQFLSVILSLLTVILLFFAVKTYFSELRGFVAAFFLMSTPFFLTQSGSQGADISLSLLILTTMIISFMVKKDKKNNRCISVLTGIFLGFSIWMKNEGAIFATIFILVALLFRFKKIKYIIIGFIPLTVLLFVFKFFLSQAGTKDFNFTLQYIIENMKQVSRFRLVFHIFKFQVPRFGEWVIQPWALIFIYILVCLLKKYRINKDVTIYLIVILGMILFYALSFALASNLNLSWHINNSLNRLLIQLWPSFIFILFSIFKKKEI